MHPLSRRLDQALLDLAWSLWTELGVSGVIRRHQNVLISLEELILLTSVLSEIDPRLFQESLDWCSQYHRFVSVSRLKCIMKSLGESINLPFSVYASTLNKYSRTVWPLPLDIPPLKFTPTGKSCLRPLESPALLNIRVRSLFGPGARADLVTFFLTHPKSNFAVADLVEIGYSKRNLAEILEEFSLSGLFERSMQRNQQRYRLARNDRLIKVLVPVPRQTPSWSLILKFSLSIRQCIKQIENYSESTRVVEIRNLLIEHKDDLDKLGIISPVFQRGFQEYLTAFDNWLMRIFDKFAHGDFDK